MCSECVLKMCTSWVLEVFRFALPSSIRLLTTVVDGTPPVLTHAASSGVKPSYTAIMRFLIANLPAIHLILSISIGFVLNK